MYISQRSEEFCLLLPGFALKLPTCFQYLLEGGLDVFQVSRNGTLLTFFFFRKHAKGIHGHASHYSVQLHFLLLSDMQKALGNTYLFLGFGGSLVTVLPRTSTDLPSFKLPLQTFSCVVVFPFPFPFPLFFFFFFPWEALQRGRSVKAFSEIIKAELRNTVICRHA